MNSSSLFFAKMTEILWDTRKGSMCDFYFYLSGTGRLGMKLVVRRPAYSICLVRVYNEGLIIFWEIGPNTFVRKDHRQVRTKNKKKKYFNGLTYRS